MKRNEGRLPAWAKALFGRRMQVCALNGFSCGLPLFYLLQLVPAWLRENGVDLKTIGLLSLIGLPYSWKFLWSPLLDRYAPPFGGRRRGWMMITQCALTLCMAGLAFVTPDHGVWTAAGLACCMAFFSASQDIVQDAYRREFLTEREFGVGNAWYVNGYRLAGLVPGSLGLILADHLPWGAVHLLMACVMAMTMIFTLSLEELPAETRAPRTLKEAVTEPLGEFFRRDGAKRALVALAFLALYKLGDNLATALATPFYLDVGFTKTQIGLVVKSVSLAALLSGGFLGGAVIWRLGINRALWLFAPAQAAPILGFALLAVTGPSVPLLAVVIGLEYFGAGMGTSALTAYMSKLTDVRYSATQFALLSSLIALPRTFAGACAGFLVEGVDGVWDGLGYPRFFVLCAFLALPGMALLPLAAPWRDRSGGGKDSFGA